MSANPCAPPVARVPGAERLQASARAVSWDFYLHAAEAAHCLGLDDEAHNYLCGALAELDEEGCPDPRAAHALNAIGVSHGHFGNRASAKFYFRRAIAVYEAALGPDHPELLDVLCNLGLVLAQEDHLEEALRTYHRALALAEEVHGSSHPEVAFILDEVGTIEGKMGNTTAAVFSLRRALGIKENTLGPDDWSTTVTLLRLADLYQRERRGSEVDALLGRSLQIRQRLLGDDDPSFAPDLIRLGDLYASQGKAAAEVPLVRAVESAARALPPRQSALGAALRSLAQVYREHGRMRQLRQLVPFAVSILRWASAPASSKRTTALEFYREMVQALQTQAEPEPGAAYREPPRPTPRTRR